MIEIYPRVLTGPVDNGRFWSRHDHLHENFSGQNAVLLERAAGSEDAFDAAFSALRMAEHLTELEHLQHSIDETELLEGCVWVPAPPPGTG